MALDGQRSQRVSGTYRFRRSAMTARTLLPIPMSVHFTSEGESESTVRTNQDLFLKIGFLPDRNVDYIARLQAVGRLGPLVCKG